MLKPLPGNEYDSAVIEKQHPIVDNNINNKGIINTATNIGHNNM